MISDIMDVAYRHTTLPTAYVKVGGHSPRDARLNAKKVCAALIKLLDDATVESPRPLPERIDQKHICEIPIVLGNTLQEAEHLLTEALAMVYVNEQP